MLKMIIIMLKINIAVAVQSCLTLCYPHGLQHTRLPCPSPSPGAGWNSCPLSWWCHPTICCPLLLLSVFLASGSFPHESVPPIRWPKYWSFSFSISSSNEYSKLISRIDWLDLLAVQGLSRVFSNTTIQKHQWKYFNKSIYCKLNAYFNSGNKFYRRKIFS